MEPSSSTPAYGRTRVQTHQIQISNGRDRADEIRSELFAFPEVLDVFITSRPDALVVVCSGRPHPGEWLRALRAVGYGTPARETAVAPERASAVPVDQLPRVTELRSAA